MLTDIYVNTILKTDTIHTIETYSFIANTGDVIKLNTIVKSSFYIFTGYSNYGGLLSKANPYEFTVGNSDIYVHVDFEFTKYIFIVGGLLIVGFAYFLWRK